ncbi:nitroreductase [Actinocorallia herbida]|uniref:Nitroreductase n=1 Tax=Actinocorallia herbida TaxID=58109 RepID=A0A3N1CYW8_9ACTN|nr:nitroreductase family protein [Actinocorallia herbida]ROO86481.1 nitroreductase [Actinocorallia herbida]
MTAFDNDAVLPLTGLDLLTTTRAVRKRLDTTRPVSRDALRECVRIALQAPAGSNNVSIRYLIVDDPELIAKLGALYQAGFDVYRGLDGIYIGSIHKDDPAEAAQQARTAASAEDLAEKMPHMPAIVIGCVEGVTRPENMPGWVTASMHASAMPALWSFMLAARLHGLGTCWTSVHLQQEQAAAELLGIPYDTVSQLMLTPVAHYTGDTFQPVTRPDPDTLIHWNRWGH